MSSTTTSTISTYPLRFAGWQKHKYWIVNFWRWLTGTRIPRYEPIPTTVFPFPERSAPINMMHRDLSVKRSSTTTKTGTSTNPKSSGTTVCGDDDGRYEDWRRKRVLDDEETIPTYYPLLPSESYNISGGDDSHVDFGGGSGDGGGASGSWEESSSHGSGYISHDYSSDSSSYDSSSSSDSSSYDSGSYDSGSSDSGGGGD